MAKTWSYHINSTWSTDTESSSVDSLNIPFELSWIRLFLWLCFFSKLPVEGLFLYISRPPYITSTSVRRMLDLGQDYRCQCWTLKGADLESLLWIEWDAFSMQHWNCGTQQTGIEPCKAGIHRNSFGILWGIWTGTIISRFLWDWRYPMFGQLRSNFIRNQIRCILCILCMYIYNISH